MLWVTMTEQMWRGIKMGRVLWAAMSAQSSSTKRRRNCWKLEPAPSAAVLCPAPGCTAVCVVQLHGHSQAGALGHVQKKSAPVLSVSLRRHLQLVLTRPDVRGVVELAEGKILEEWAEETAPFVWPVGISCWRQDFVVMSAPFLLQESKCLALVSLL